MMLLFFKYFFSNLLFHALFLLHVVYSRILTDFLEGSLGPYGFINKFYVVLVGRILCTYGIYLVRVLRSILEKYL